MPDQITAPSTRAPAHYVPFPDPTLHSPPCPGCGGTGITGGHALMQTSEGKPPLLLDMFCPHCDGCGNAYHTACDLGAHANDDVAELMPVEDDSIPQCPSCGGCEYAAVQGWPSEGSVDDEMVTLRLPCGCTTDRVELVEIVWRDGEITDIIRPATPAATTAPDPDEPPADETPACRYCRDAPGDAPCPMCAPREEVHRYLEAGDEIDYARWQHGHETAPMLDRLGAAPELGHGQR